MDSKQYLIADARKEQIINAAIDVLKASGYINTSLSKIAKQAGVSTGLLSYHFSGKDDLMVSTLAFLVQKEKMFIHQKVEEKQTYMDKLITFIEASLAYQVIHHGHTKALLEIVFNARTEDNTPYYLVETDVENELHVLLKDILYKGQELEEFDQFDVDVIGTIIRGAIAGSLNLPQYEIDSNLEAYSEKMIENILKMVKR